MQKFRAGTDQRRMERLGALQRAGVAGFTKPGMRVYRFPGAAVTKCHRRGGFKRQKYILSQSCRRKSEIEELVGLCLL